MRKNNLLAIIIVLALVGFIWAYSSGSLPTFSNLKNSGNVYCEKNIIPNRITINEGGVRVDSRYIDKIYTTPNFASGWKDGTRISVPPSDEYIFSDTEFSVSCHSGSREGENVNYLYCSNLVYSKTTQGVSEEGVIGKKIEKSYGIDLILKPEGVWEFEGGPILNLLSKEGTSRAGFNWSENYIGNGAFLDTFGEAWAEEPPSYPDSSSYDYYIYRNYSIVSSRCA